MSSDTGARTPHSETELRHWDAWVNADTATVTTRSEEGAESEAGSLRIAGYAVVFNQSSRTMGGMIDEVIDPRAFDGLDLNSVDVRLLGEHNGSALARTTNGTLKLKLDDKGLAFEAVLNPDAQAARDLHALIERGDVTQMSFGFIIGKTEREACDHRDCDLMHVRITEIRELLEISAVTFPAYPQTSVEGMPNRSVSGEVEGDLFRDELVALDLDLAHGGADTHGSSQSKA